MSHLVCLASDAPLPVLPNPHLKLLSVNEALSQGLDVPKSMLEDPEIDPDEPETFLWSDISIEINPETGEVTPPPEDCWDIWPIECADHLQTSLPHLAEVEWPECTPGRAAVLADYIRRQLETAETVELWNFWDGSDVELTCVHREEIRLAELTPEKIAALCEKDAAYPVKLGPVEEFQQYCLSITR